MGDEGLSSREAKFIQIVHFDFFYGQKQALSDIEIDIPEREITAFIGPSVCACQLVNQPMKILIVDDHAISSEGLKRILSDEFKSATFGNASNATEAIELAWKHKWDLVLLDITMHGRTGCLESLQEIRSSLRRSQKLLSGGKYISASLAEQLAGEIQSPQRDPREALSNREYQIMLFIAAGKVPKEIG